MKKAFLLLPLILLIAAFQSKPGNSLIRIKQVDNLKTGSSASYTYDEQGRILTSKSSKGPGAQYQYTSNVAIKQLSAAGNIGAQTDTFRLNSNGWVEMEADNYEGKTQSLSKYKYDVGGFMVEARQFINGSLAGTASYVIVKGNRTDYTYIDEKKEVLSKVHYTYYNDKINTIGEENMGMLFHGRDSKNLFKESIGLNAKGDTVSINFYSYKFDNQGRVTQRVLRQKNGALQDSTGYVYY